MKLYALVVVVALAGAIPAPSPALGAPPLEVPEVDALEVQAVVDNYYDFFQKEETCAKRHLFLRGAGFEDVRVQAEMGLAYVITATVSGKRHLVLFDFGLSESVYRNNLERLRVPDLSKAEALVLSHAHQDHYGGVSIALERSRAPFYVGGADAFAHRTAVTPQKTIDMQALDRSAIEKRNRLMVVPEPTLVAGVAVTTGQIPRLTGYEKVPPIFQIEKNGATVADTIAHEHALVFRVRGRGLVVIASCAHAGVINTIEQARKVTGESRILAVIGGMHLTTAPDEAIDATIAALEAVSPTYVAPMHCTGNRALVKLATRFPDAYVHPSVGTRYVFEASQPAK